MTEVIAETSKRAVWCNHQRLRSGIDFWPPLEVRDEWVDQGVVEQAAAEEVKKDSLCKTRCRTAR